MTNDASPWDFLKSLTPARIGLPRAGAALGTRSVLELGWAHARARQAVHRAWDSRAFAGVCGGQTIPVQTSVHDRTEFLLRPDRGRALDDKSLARLREHRDDRCELVLCVSDGLSSLAVDRHFPPLWKLLRPQVEGLGLRTYPLVIVPFGRVAVSDAIGHALGARLAVIFIGERPGLSAADSLGCYLTYHPAPGRNDSERNCISNIRPPAGLSYELATAKLTMLIRDSLRLQISGIGLTEAELVGDRVASARRSCPEG